MQLEQKKLNNYREVSAVKNVKH